MLEGLGKSSGLENVLFWHSQDAFYGHQRILKRWGFVDCEACRGSWGLFEGLIVESGRAVDGENKRTLVESVFSDFEVRKCDFDKGALLLQNDDFDGFGEINGVVEGFRG